MFRWLGSWIDCDCKFTYFGRKNTAYSSKYVNLQPVRNQSGHLDAMIIQFGIIFGCLALGELIVWLTGVSVPASIIGMLLLTGMLQLRIIKPQRVERLADFLTHNLGFFFVPAGVGLMECLGLVAREWVPIVVASVGSTAVIIAVTGHVHQQLRLRQLRRARRHSNSVNTQH